VIRHRRLVSTLALVGCAVTALTGCREPPPENPDGAEAVRKGMEDPAASGATPSTAPSVPAAPEVRVIPEGFGWCMCWAGDWSADGVGDIAVGTPRARLPGGARVGSVSILSGRDGHCLLQEFGERDGVGFGASLCAWEAEGGSPMKAAATLAVGRVPWTYKEAAPEARADPNAGTGRVMSMSKDVAFRRRTFDPPVGVLEFGELIACLGDIDGDGASDLLVVCGRGRIELPRGDIVPGPMIALSGETGVELWRAPTTPLSGMWGPWSMTLVPDLDGDGRRDLFGGRRGRESFSEGGIAWTDGTWSSSTGESLGRPTLPGEDRIEGILLGADGSSGGGEVTVLRTARGASGQPRYSVGRLTRVPSESGPGAIVWSELWGGRAPEGSTLESAALGRAADGREFAILGAPSHSSGRTWIVDRARPDDPRPIANPTEARGFGWRVLSGRDIDGDDTDDIIVTATGMVDLALEGSQDLPVSAFSGKDLRPLWTVYRQR
jgi:hypothetical protein